jgi:uncharacterized membrane protein (DUF485 family)
MISAKLRLGIVLSCVVAVLYFAFVVFAALSPGMLTQPVIGAVPLSFILAALLIVGAIGLTGLYVIRANALEDAQ